MRGDIFVSFALVADVDEAVVNAHFKFGGGGVVRSLFGVKLF